MRLLAKTQAKVICEFFGIAYVEQAVTQIYQDIDVLAGAGIVNSSEYWKTSREYKYEYVQALIHKMAGYMRGK